MIDKIIHIMYNFVMKRYERNDYIIGIILVLLIIPTIIYWKEILIISVLVLLAKTIYKYVNKITIKNDNNIYFNDDVKLEQTEYNQDIEKEYELYIRQRYVKKGMQAEYKLVNILQRIFPISNIIHDSYFRDDELVTTQVDVIAIDSSGIYVIESKAYSGILVGKTDEKNWTQLFGGKKYHKFSNPVIQNKRHLNAVVKNLSGFGIPKEAFKSYVVFDNNCKLDIENTGSNTKIIKQKELFYTILKDRKSTEGILTNEQITNISRRLKAHSNVDNDLRMQHVIRRQNNIKYVKKRG